MADVANLVDVFGWRRLSAFLAGHGNIPEEQAERESSQTEFTKAARQRCAGLRSVSHTWAGSLSWQSKLQPTRAPPLLRSHIFFASPSGLSLAFVNLKPLVPGHVLVRPRVASALSVQSCRDGSLVQVTPRRVAPRLADLSEEELGGETEFSPGC